MMTPRQRMLSAYQDIKPDLIPVAPEFWCYIPARVLGISMIELELDVPHWQALQQTFRHYGCEGWGIVAPETPPGHGSKLSRQQRWLTDGSLEEITTAEVMGRTLRSRRIYDRREPSWQIERYIKDFDQDWPAYVQMTILPVEELDWRPVQEALDKVGEDYLLEVYLGEPFVDYAGGQREGGLEQVLIDLTDRPDEMKAIQEQYIAYMAAKTRAAFHQTNAKSVFVGSGWSSLSLLSPAIWRKWDKPVLEAVVQAAHECGGFVHHHFHGRCMKVLPELAALGLDCICPFERPPGGDVTDLKQVRELLAEKVTFNGNVHTVDTLIRGKPSDVRREVMEILEAFLGSPRLIIGTGDQVGWDTPEENIAAMIETARQHGKL